MKPLLWLLTSLAIFLAAMQAAHAQYITDVMLIGHKNKNDIASLKAKYQNEGWTRPSRPNPSF